MTRRSSSRIPSRPRRSATAIARWRRRRSSPWLHPDEHGAAATVADAAAQTPGVQVRALGGLGSYQAISIRGTASGNTTVLVDGRVLLARLAEVTTDLGRFALASFGRVDIYRGAVPIELGGAGVGGAVNMVTRVGRDAAPAARGRMLRRSGCRSATARAARATHARTTARTGARASPVRPLRLLAHAGGDFTFFDNRGTPLPNPHDDTAYTRRVPQQRLHAARSRRAHRVARQTRDGARR